MCKLNRWGSYAPINVYKIVVNANKILSCEVKKQTQI
jgi:hypothetical protein